MVTSYTYNTATTTKIWHRKAVSGFIPRFSLLSSKRPYLAIHLDRDHGRKNDWAPMILRMPSCHYISRRYGRSVIMWDYGGWHPTTLPTSSHSNLTLFALSPPPPPPALWTHPPGRPPATPRRVYCLMDTRVHACWRNLEVSVIFRSYWRLCRTPLSHPPIHNAQHTRTTQKIVHTHK